MFVKEDILSISGVFSGGVTEAEQARVRFAGEVGLFGAHADIDLIAPGSGDVDMFVYIVEIKGELAPLLAIEESYYLLWKVPFDVKVEVV